jgi:hypothetical protein
VSAIFGVFRTTKLEMRAATIFSLAYWLSGRDGITTITLFLPAHGMDWSGGSWTSAGF